ncbi:MAG: carbohydrate ABC transporter permease [Caldilineaceae bacterium]
MAEQTLSLPLAPASTPLAWYQRRGTRSLIGRTLAFLLALAGAIGFLIPFLWAVSTSLKPSSQIFTFPPIWIPSPILWSNYTLALTELPFVRYFANTGIITFGAMIGDVFVSTIVAYGFARMRFPGRDALFLVLIGTMMLPMQVTMIPIFIIFRTLGWVDTFLPLIVPAYFGSAFYIFLLRQFFLTIPSDLEDAALIDGAGNMTTLWRIFVPLSLPAMATVAIFSFMHHWQDFFMPLIYLNSKELKTVALALQMFRAEFSTDWNLMMAAAVTTTIPCLLLFFFAQRYFISGIVMTGLKD